MFKVALIAMLPLSALAEGRGDAFAALLAEVPLAVASPGGEGIDLHFSDYVAVAPLVAAVADQVQPGRDGPIGWHIRAGTPYLSESIGMTGGSDWPNLVGFGLPDLRQSIVAGRPPDVLTVLALDPDVVPGIAGVLEANGYAPDDRLGVPAWWRGQEDFAVNFDLRNPGDPFGGNLGQSSRVAVQGSVLMRSAGWPSLAAAFGEYPVVTDLPGVQALLAALDDPALGQGALIRAMLLPRSESLAVTPLPFTLDMTEEEVAAALAALGATPDPAQQALALAMVSGPALIADIAAPEAAVGVLALTFGDRAQAVAAADSIARNWTAAPSAVTGETFAVQAGPANVAVTGKGPFVTLLIVPGTTGAELRNAGFDLLFRAWMMRDLVFLPRL